MRLNRLLPALAVLGLAQFAAADVDVRKFLADALAAGQKKIVLPAGTYKVSPAKPSDSAHLVIAKADGVEIDGSGATLVFTDPEKDGIHFDDCHRLTVHHLKIDYDPLPFTQGTITAVEKASQTIAVKLDAGYLKKPEFFAGPGVGAVAGRLAAYLFDAKTGLWKTDAYDLYPAKVDLADPAAATLTFANPDAFARNGVAAGDRIVLSRRTCIGVRLNHCQASTLDDVTLYACGGIGIQENGGEGGNRFSRLTVTRGPVPDGATEPRLHSINADGFHSSAVKQGPVVENSLFEWMGDDAIAIHGTYALVTHQPAPDQITLSPKFEMPFVAGDTLTIVDGQTYQVKAAATVTKTQATAATEDPAVAALWKTYRVDVKGRKFYTLTLDRPAAVNVGDLVTSPQRVGNGFVVRNNTARHHRARGIQIKAGDGLIEGNTVEDVGMAGIILGPELSVWLGSDFVQNVVVRNNTVRGTGRGGDARLNAQGADIAGIAVRSITLDKRLSPPENKHITIENNAIENPAGLAMFLTSVDGLIVRGNTIVGPWNLGASVSGKRFGVDPGAAVFVDGCRGVLFSGNTLDLTGGTSKKAVTLGKDANDVKGKDDGFTIKTAVAVKSR